MNDLAYSPPKSEQDKGGAVPTSSTETGIQYPSLRFNGEQASKAGLGGCKYGEEYELTIRVRATRIDGGGGYPGSGVTQDKPEMQFDVLACDDPVEIESEAEDKKEGVEEKPKAKREGPKVKGPMEAGILSK